MVALDYFKLLNLYRMKFDTTLSLLFSILYYLGFDAQKTAVFIACKPKFLVSGGASSNVEVNRSRFEQGLEYAAGEKSEKVAFCNSNHCKIG